MTRAMTCLYLTAHKVDSTHVRPCQAGTMPFYTDHQVDTALQVAMSAIMTSLRGMNVTLARRLVAANGSTHYMFNRLVGEFICDFLVSDGVPVELSCMIAGHMLREEKYRKDVIKELAQHRLTCVGCRGH
jgi:hypothetical protein